MQEGEEACGIALDLSGGPLMQFALQRHAGMSQCQRAQAFTAEHIRLNAHCVDGLLELKMMRCTSAGSFSLGGSSTGWATRCLTRRPSGTPSRTPLRGGLPNDDSCGCRGLLSTGRACSGSACSASTRAGRLQPKSATVSA